VVSAKQMIVYVLKGHGFSRAIHGAEQAGLYRLRKNSIRREAGVLQAAEKLTALKGHGFSRAIHGAKQAGLYRLRKNSIRREAGVSQAAEKLTALKGHGFSRAVSTPK